MKILVLNYEYPPVGGGGGQACADLCQSLAAKGHQIRVLTARIAGIPRREIVDGYQVYRIYSGRRSRFKASFLTMIGFLVGAFPSALWQILRWKPAVIHVHFAVPTGALAFILSWLTGRRYVLTAHLGDVPGGVPEKTDRWFRVVYPLTPPIWRRACRVVAVSGFTQRLAAQWYPVPIQVIPNGVDLSEVREPPKPVGDSPQLIFAGRFQPQKNLLFLVEALAQVTDLEWHCILLGDGPQREGVLQRIQSLGLQDRVETPGWVSSDEVWARLGQSDVLVMPSLSEGLPVVGVQALAHGLAILANAAGGLTDLVDSGVNGRLCEVGDEPCFVEGLRWCLEDTQRLQGCRLASWKKAQAYDIEQVANQYEVLFEEVAALP